MEGEIKNGTKNKPEPAPANESKEKILLFLRENQIFWASFFGVVLVVLFTSHFRFKPLPELEVGSVATRDIKAPFDFQVVDELATKSKKEEAKSKVVPVYDWDTEKGAKFQEQLSLIFKKGRGIIQDLNDLKLNTSISGSEKISEEKKTIRAIEEILGPDVTRFAARQFEKEGFSPNLEEILRDILKKVGAKKIISDEENLTVYPSIKIRDIHKSGIEWEIKSPSSGEIVNLTTARRYLRELLDENQSLPPSLKAASEELLRTIIKPNLTFNSQETSIRREKAASDVPPLVVYLKKGSIVAKQGDVIDENIRNRLKNLNEASKNKVNILKLLAIMILSTILLLCAFMYFKTYKKSKKIDVNIFNLCVTLFIIFLVLTHIVDSLSKILSENSKNIIFSRSDAMLFLVPFFAGAVIVTLLIDRHIAIIFSFLLSFYAGILLDFDFKITLYSFLSSLCAIYATVNLKQKRLPLRISIFVGVANILIVILLLADDEILSNPKTLFYVLSLGFLSAFPFGLMITSTLLPILESFYNIVSDVRLFELSNLSHPLLQKLALQAPGTYNHSIMISHLAESAASHINANGLFCRVAGYYHDIGKLINPSYFVENLGGQENPHNRFKPEMSALVVKSHVKEGMKIAKSFKLPNQIIDIIPQHHGTRKISYFYDRALTVVDPEKEKINESDFCYEGPIPKTKEAAIIMLADSIEASSRVLKDPSSQRLKTMIDEIFDKILAERQLDDCDLTINDLAKLKEGFFKALVGVYARRISYPNFEFDKDQKNGKSEKG
ncbi:MAG: HD family phosphohydrolase [Acidobacteriota bacterium]